MGATFKLGALCMVLALLWDLAIAIALPFRESLDVDTYWVTRRLLTSPAYVAVLVGYLLVGFSAIRFSIRGSVKSASIRGATFLALSLVIHYATPLAARLLKWSALDWYYQPIDGRAPIHLGTLIEVLVLNERWSLPISVLLAVAGAVMLVVGSLRMALIRWKPSAPPQAVEAK